MNVCLIASGYPSPSRPVHNIFIHEQAEEMRQQGLNVRVITSGNKDSPAEETFEGMPVSRVMSSSFKLGLIYPFVFALRAALKAAQLHKIEKFDIIHAHFADHAGLAGAIISRVLRKPFILTVHGYDVNYSKELGYGLGTRWLQRIYLFFILKSADMVCPVSHVLERQCITTWHISPRKLAVTHNGTHIPELPSQDEISRFKARINPDGKKVIMSISSLIELKGQQNIIAALPGVIKELPETVFIIVGEGPYLPSLAGLTSELGLDNQVKVINRSISRGEVTLFLAICDVFALVSRLESFGIVYLEALALGKPVIASRGQGGEDFITDGENGFLVNPTDKHDLADKLVRLLKDKNLRESLGQRGKDTVMQGYLWQHSVARLREVYSNLLKN
jgi:teichuronic acid biosynthesis glycosyltransferase TuaC